MKRHSLSSARPAYRDHRTRRIGWLFVVAATLAYLVVLVMAMRATAASHPSVADAVLSIVIIMGWPTLALLVAAAVGFTLWAERPPWISRRRRSNGHPGYGDGTLEQINDQARRESEER